MKILISIFIINFLSCACVNTNSNSTKEIQLSFSGDLMAHDVNYKRKPYLQIYKRIQYILESNDLNFCNLEFPVIKNLPNSTFPKFNVHPDYVEAAIYAGYNAFSLANNHATDQGENGIFETIKSLEELKKTYPIYFTGTNTIMDAEIEPILIEIKGFKIGFVSATNFLNEYIGRHYVNLLIYENSQTQEAFLNKVKEWNNQYDLLIFSYHTGKEYSGGPSKQLKAFFSRLVNSGVDIVWAHHPHVLQPYHIEKIDGSKKLIIYSNGNLISGQTWSIKPEQVESNRAATGESAIFIVTIRQTQGKTQITKVVPIHTVNVMDPEFGMLTIAPLEDVLDNKIKIHKKWRNYYQKRSKLNENLKNF